MLRWAKFLILALSLLLIGSFPLAPQIAKGSLQGAVTNESGPVAKASVDIRNVITGLFLHTESDAKGNYQFENLRAGRYSLWVQAPGNDSVWIPEVFVENGQTTRQSVKLGSVRRPYSGFVGGLSSVRELASAWPLSAQRKKAAGGR